MCVCLFNIHRPRSFPGRSQPNHSHFAAAPEHRHLGTVGRRIQSGSLSAGKRSQSASGSIFTVQLRCAQLHWQQVRHYGGAILRVLVGQELSVFDQFTTGGHAVSNGYYHEIGKWI